MDDLQLRSCGKSGCLRNPVADTFGLFGLLMGCVLFFGMFCVLLGVYHCLVVSLTASTYSHPPFFFINWPCSAFWMFYLLFVLYRCLVVCLVVFDVHLAMDRELMDDGPCCVVDHNVMSHVLQHK